MKPKANSTQISGKKILDLDLNTVWAIFSDSFTEEKNKFLFESNVFHSPYRSRQSLPFSISWTRARSSSECFYNTLFPNSHDIYHIKKTILVIHRHTRPYQEMKIASLERQKTIKILFLFLWFYTFFLMNSCQKEVSISHQIVVRQAHYDIFRRIFNMQIFDF